MGLQPKFDVLEITNCGKSLAVDYSGTIFTNLGARTITVLIAFPSKILTTFGDSRANFSNSSEEISGDTSNLALNFKAVFEVFYLALVRIFIINE